MPVHTPSTRIGTTSATRTPSARAIACSSGDARSTRSYAIDSPLSSAATPGMSSSRSVSARDARIEPALRRHRPHAVLAAREPRAVDGEQLAHRVDGHALDLRHRARRAQAAHGEPGHFVVQRGVAAVQAADVAGEKPRDLARRERAHRRRKPFGDLDQEQVDTRAVQPVDDVGQPVAAPAQPARGFQAQLPAARVEIVRIARKRRDDRIEHHAGPLAVCGRQTARGVHAPRDGPKLGVVLGSSAAIAARSATSLGICTTRTVTAESRRSFPRRIVRCISGRSRSR